jgi:transketolase
LVSGVEATTGPLGQGIATSVGMAIARKWLASRYNKPGFALFDYNIYAICGDGDMMEGVGSEAASLAGHLALDDLCWIYDNNHITIDGKTKITFTEDVAARYLAYHWNVLRVGDANDLESIEEALAVFRKTKDRPTLIILDSHIGYGSPHKVDTSAAHGEPLGEDEVKLVKRAYHWPENAKFLVPDGVIEHFADGIGQRGGKARRDWEAMFAKYRESFPDLARRLIRCNGGSCPPGGTAICQAFRRIRRESPGAMLRARCSMFSARIFPGFSAAQPISHRQTGRCSNSAVQGNSNPARPKAAIFISASASTRWPRSSTVCRSRSYGPLDRPSSSSATTPGRPFGSRRSWNCRQFSFSPTTPWAMAKMDRLISQLSS